MNKPWLKFSLKIFVAVGLLAVILYKSDIKKIFDNLVELPLSVLFMVLVLNFAFSFAKVFRWRLLLPQYPVKTLFQLSFISQFYSFISAGQVVGEAAKVYILGKGRAEAGQVAMSVVVDKITGIIGVVLIGTAGIIFTGTILPEELIWSFAAITILCLVFLFLARWRFFYGKMMNIANRLESSSAQKLKRVIGWFIKFIEAWHVYSQKTKILLLSIILSLFFQLIVVASFMILGHGFGINISFLDWCWLLGIFFGLTSLPITIGGLGIREGSLVGLLGFFMVAPEKALAFSLACFGLQLIFALIGGVVEIKRTKVFNIKGSILAK